MRHLWNRIAQTAAARAYGVALGALSLIVTARLLGPAGRGELAAVTTWVATVSTLVYLSLGQVAIRRAAEAGGAAWLPPAYRALLTFVLALTALGWAAAAAGYWLTGGAIFGGLSPWLLALGFLALPFLIWEQYSSALLTALDRLAIYNYYQIAGRTVAFAGALAALLLAGAGVPGVLASTVAGQAIVAGGGLAFLHGQAGGWGRPGRAELASFLAGGARLHLNAVGTFLLVGLDILMVNYYRGAEETGYYQLGAQLLGIMLIVPNAVSMVMYSQVATLGPNRAWAHQRRLLLQTLLLMLGGALLAGATAPLWLVWLAGEAFAPAVALFRWQLLAVVGMTGSVVLSAQWIGRGYFVQASALTLAIGAANVLANLWLIPRFGMYGAAYATAGAYTLALLANALMALHCEREARNDDGAAPSA